MRWFNTEYLTIFKLSTAPGEIAGLVARDYSECRTLPNALDVSVVVKLRFQHCYSRKRVRKKE